MSAGLRAGTNNDGYLQINGTDVLTALSSGRIGVGTTNPSAILDVKVATDAKLLVQDGNTTGNVKFNAVNNAVTGNVNFEIAAQNIQFFAGGSEKLRVTSTGNVGIGTTNPSNLLTLGASGGPTMRLVDTTSGAFSILIGGSNGDLTFSADHGNTGSSTNIIFSNDGNQERLRIDSAGNTSIGGFAPSVDDLGGKNLEIGFAGNMIKGYQTGNMVFVNNSYFQGGWKYANTGKAVTYYQLNGDVATWQNAPSGTAGTGVTFTERMRLDSSGNLGIGSTSPARKLDVADSGVNGSVVRSKVTTNNGGYLAYEALNSSGTSVFSVTHNGRINLSENIVFAAGQGLDFSATANSSGTMTSELFDDYEIGTWTPTYTGATTVSTSRAYYIKIGKKVTCYLSCNITGGSAGTFTATLPFASDTTTSTGANAGIEGGGTVMLNNPVTPTNANQITAYVWSSSLTFYWTYSTTVGWSQATGAQLGSAFISQFTYIATT